MTFPAGFWIKTEEKAKVAAVVWLAESLNFFAALAILLSWCKIARAARN